MIVEDAAKRLQMNPQTLRLALQQGLFPFGVAVKTSENRYTYKIFETRLEKYLEGSNEEGCSICHCVNSDSNIVYDWLSSRSEEHANSCNY